MLVNIGKGIELDVDANALPANSINHIVYLGLRNALMDAHAGVKREDFANESDWHDASREVAMKKLHALFSGEIRANGTTRTRSTNPLDRELNRLAKSHGDAALKAGKTTEAGLDAWKAAFKRKPAVIALAQANVDIADAIGDDNDE